MKSDRSPVQNHSPSNGVRSVQPREPLTRRQHVLLGIGLIAGLLFLILLAWTVRQWQLRVTREPSVTETLAVSSELSETSIPTPTLESPVTTAISPDAFARGSQLVIGCVDPVNQINPLYLGNLSERDASSLIFESLLQFDTDGRAENKLALDQSYDSETHQMTFTIRDDHFFTDGSILTAADVAFTYQLALAQSYDGPLKAYLAGLQAVSTTDDQTVMFQLADWVQTPDPAWFTIGILNEDAYDIDLDRVFELGLDPVWPEGSGAYQLRDLSDGTAILELRPGFASELTRLEFLQIDSQFQYDLLNTGAIDITYANWDARSKERLDSLTGYAATIFPQTRAYVLVNRTASTSTELAAANQQDAILAVLAGRAPTTEQTDYLDHLSGQSLNCPYYQGIDEASQASYLEDATKAVAVLSNWGIQITFEPCDWPDLASRALENRYILMVIPAPANERLPSGVVMLSSFENLPPLSLSVAIPAVEQEKVLLFSKRLMQLTVNSNESLLSSVPLGWTDRIENIRLAESADETRSDQTDRTTVKE